MASIVLDLDDVVLDFTGTWRRLYREWFDEEPTKQTSWDDPMGAPRLASKDEFFEWFDWIDGWREVGYLPGAQGGIWDLLRTSMTIHFVTARHGSGASAASRWWKRSPWNTTTFLHTNVQNKVGTVVPYARLYIDDNPACINEAVEQGRAAIVFDRPWNQGEAVHEAARRATNWREVVSLALAGVKGETVDVSAGD